MAEEGPEGEHLEELRARFDEVAERQRMFHQWQMFFGVLLVILVTIEIFL